MTQQDSPEVRIAEEWLKRQKATNGDDLLDEGDCRFCGRPNGEGHEPTDPCGIVAGLLGRLHEQAQEIERVNALLRVTTGHEGDGSIACGHCGHRIASDGVIEALTAEIKRAEAAESALAAAQQIIREHESGVANLNRVINHLNVQIEELTQGHASPP